MEALTACWPSGRVEPPSFGMEQLGPVHEPQVFVGVSSQSFLPSTFPPLLLLFFCSSSLQSASAPEGTSYSSDPFFLSSSSSVIVSPVPAVRSSWFQASEGLQPHYSGRPGWTTAPQHRPLTGALCWQRWRGTT